MQFVTTFPLSGNGTDFREFGYTGSSDDISGCWISVTICVSGARHSIFDLIFNKQPLILSALQPPWVLASDFQFYDHFTDGRIPWTSDQLVARPLPKHRTTQTQNKHVHTKYPCLVWNSNPRSRLPRERRQYMP
jgi:hypothetical protein